MRLLRFLAVAALLLGGGPALATPGYFALLIANSEYSHPDWPTLKTPQRDVAVLNEILTQRYGFQTTVLRNATRSQIIDEIEILRGRLGEEDSLMIYFAGHGILRPGDGGYWVGADANATSRSGWLKYDSIDDLIDFKGGMKARHVLVVADSCYSGAALRSRGEFENTQGTPFSELLRRRAQLRSRTVLTSGGTEPVLDSVGSTEHSVFAAEFLDKLRGNQAIIDGHSLFKKIEPEVFGRAQRVLGSLAQAPEYGSLKGIGHDGGDFLFIPVGMALPESGSDSTPGPGSDLGLRGPTTVVYSEARQTHIGDEAISDWPAVHGQCYSITFEYPDRIDSLLLRYDIYGAENTFVDFNGTIIPFESQIPPQGRKRPNYWENDRSFPISAGRTFVGPVTLRICSRQVKDPGFPGDLDDFQLRNVSLRVN